MSEESYCDFHKRYPFERFAEDFAVNIPGEDRFFAYSTSARLTAAEIDADYLQLIADERDNGIRGALIGQYTKSIDLKLRVEAAMLAKEN